MRFPEKVRKVRELNNLSQKDLAKKIGVSTVVYGKYERGVTEPGISKLEKIAEILNVTPNDLLLDDESVSQVNEDQVFLTRTTVNVDRVNLKVSAGHSGVASQEREQVDQEHWPVLPSKTPAGYRWVVFQVDGDSMFPTIEHNDYICCDLVDDGYSPGVYMIRFQDGSFSCKQIQKIMDRSSDDYGKLELISHNRSYGSQVITVDSVSKAWRVIKVIRIDNL